MKKIFLIVATLCCFNVSYAQVIYTNSFDAVGLQTYTTSGSSTKFSAVPAGFSLIDDGYKNNIGTLTNPNKPFNEPGLKKRGWAVVFNQAENDTFLVSTSWLDTTAVAVDRWVITPPISNISANSFLTWLAKSPDANFLEGYEVYGTSSTGVLTSQSFVIGDRLFALADGSTSGAGEKNTWTRRSVNLSAFAGQTLRFAFRNNSKDMYQLWIDDILVVNVNKNYDAAITSDVQKKYLLVNTTDSVKFNITNLGATTLTTVNVSYQTGNSTINTENLNISGGLTYGQSTILKFALPHSVSSPGYYPVRSWINSLNGQADQFLTNDTTIYSLTIQNASAPKTVLIEQFVSANDGESPDAQEKAQALQSSQVIVVNIHDQDSMKENNSAALLNDYKKNTATAMVDRFYFNDLKTTAIERQAYAGRVTARKSTVSPVTVSVINKSYNALTRQLSFTLKADFTGEVKGDYRLNAYLTENYVSGPVLDTAINGFNQLNNFYGLPWSLYYQQGYYSPLVNTHVLNYWQYQHANTLVHAFGGAYGTSGIIPSNGGTLGQSYQQTFTLTIPTATNGIHKFNSDNLYIVGFAAEYSNNKNQRNVLNAVKEKLTGNPEAVGIPERSSHKNFGIYPNPSNGVFYISGVDAKNHVEVVVFDLVGRPVKKLDNSGGELNLSVLQAGVYVVKISSGDEQYTQKVIIQK